MFGSFSHHKSPDNICVCSIQDICPRAYTKCITRLSHIASAQLDRHKARGVLVENYVADIQFTNYVAVVDRVIYAHA